MSAGLLGHTWYSPRFTMLGVLGEPNGPTLDQVRQAKSLRFALKIDEAARKRAAISSVTPTPRLVGGTVFASGVDRPSWADPKPTAADPNNDLPF